MFVVACVHGICNEMHSQMCILRTLQAFLQGACSCEGIGKISKMLGMKWLKSWVLMGIVGSSRFMKNAKDRLRHIYVEISLKG